MSPLQLAKKYLEIFYGGGPLEPLMDLFAENLSFKGPYHQFETAEAYIASLLSDPPSDLNYQILQAWENESSACLIYRFSRPGVTTLMSQTFEVENGKICKILLLFDTADFS